MKERIKDFIIKNLKWIILFICLIGFLALAEDVFNKEIMKGDIIGYKVVSTFLISDFATLIAKFITNFGGAIFLIILTILLIVVLKNKKVGLSICINLVVVTILNQLLKRLLQRPRPLKYYRQRKQMTTRQLAEKLDIVPSTVVMYENGKRPIPYDVAIKLADVLEIEATLLCDDFSRFLSFSLSHIEM